MIGEYVAAALSAGLVFFLFWDCLQACIQIRATPRPPDNFSAVMDRIYSAPARYRLEEDDDGLDEEIRRAEQELAELELADLPEEERPDEWTFINPEIYADMRPERRTGHDIELQITNR